MCVWSVSRVLFEVHDICVFERSKGIHGQPLTIAVSIIYERVFFSSVVLFLLFLELNNTIKHLIRIIYSYFVCTQALDLFSIRSWYKTKACYNMRRKPFKIPEKRIRQTSNCAQPAYRDRVRARPNQSKMLKEWKPY